MINSIDVYSATVDEIDNWNGENFNCFTKNTWSVEKLTFFILLITNTPNSAPLLQKYQDVKGMKYKSFSTFCYEWDWDIFNFGIFNETAKRFPQSDDRVSFDIKNCTFVSILNTNNGKIIGYTFDAILKSYNELLTFLFDISKEKFRYKEFSFYHYRDIFEVVVDEEILCKLKNINKKMLKQIKIYHPEFEKNLDTGFFLGSCILFHCKRDGYEDYEFGGF